jgi:putative acetyltransferase
MAEATPKFGLRPMLPADAPVLADIFRASIEGLTGEDYSPDQQNAWMSAADYDADFGKRLLGGLTLVATLHHSPVAFASLEGADRIHMLYVHPAVGRQGVATMLIDALEKLAGGRGVERLTADASDTARQFFSQRGYVAQRRNTVSRGDEWLSNTTMEKQLGRGGGAAQGGATTSSKEGQRQ